MTRRASSQTSRDCSIETPNASVWYQDAPAARPEIQAPVGQDVERGGALGDADRVVARQHDHPVPQPDPRGPGCQRRQEDLGRRAVGDLLVEVMLGRPVVVEADLLGEHRLGERVPVDPVVDASTAVDRLRDEYVPRAFGQAADRVYVGGQPAEARDAFAVNIGWLPIVIAVVLTLSFILLTLAFRSITIAATAIVVNLLSVGAAYGILVAVFQNGVAIDLLGFTEVERIDSWVPIFLFSVLFGLSMDYQVFLLSRIHERWAATGDTPGAIVHGVASTARLITGAAAIIIVVFAGFASGQLVALQEMGFGIAIALALDATLVRLLLIPAAMRLLGDRNWYLPRWLAWLPDVHIEGPQTDMPTADPPAATPASTARPVEVAK